MKRASTGDRFHGVRFYDDAESLCRIVTKFVSDGLADDQPAVIIAVPPHREAIRQELHGLAFDVERLEALGHLRLLDAEETMSMFMREGSPDPVAFQASIGAVIDAAADGRPHAVVRAYGDMVDCLWKKDAADAAIQLELLWNQLAQARHFSLLCGYSIGNFYKHGAYESICGQHTHVVSAGGQVTPVGVTEV